MTDLEEQPGRSSQRRLLLSSGHLVPTLGLLSVYVLIGAGSVLVGGVLSFGIDPIFLVYANNLSSFVFLSPLAACIERRNWPQRLSKKLVVHLVLISLGGVTAFQTLITMGLQMTSPAIASAMSNLIPGLVFVISCCLKFEKFDRKCRYSAAKAVGTLLCVGGVVAMSLLQQAGNAASNPSTVSLTIGAFGDRPSQQWITGCVYLFLAVCLFSCTTLLQASALKDLPAPLSLTAITSLMGSIFTAALQLVSKGKLGPENYTISTTFLAAYIVLSSAVASLCYTFQMWCIKKQGPVFVSMFSPIGTVTSTVLSAVVLGKFLALGSLAGVIVMIIGLYIVLWAKRKECALPIYVYGHQDDNNNDAEKNRVDDDRVLKKPLLG